MRRITIALLTLALFVASEARAEKVLDNGDTVLNIGFLIQPLLRATSDASPEGGVATAPGIRRARLLVFGNLTKQISFFAETESPNVGLGGDWAPQFYILDAYLSFGIIPELNIDAGLLLAPFSHHGLQGATSLNTLDYHLPLIRYPKTIGKVFRDVGVQLRGLMFDKRIHYRVALLNGVEGSMPPAGMPEGTPPVNPSDIPRFTGTLRYNILGSEPGFFFQGIYFATDPIISVGISGDAQPKAVLMGMNTASYFAASADVFVDYPLDENNEVVAQVAYYRWSQGQGSTNTGHGLFGELGYRWSFVEPVVSAEWFRPDDVASGQAMNWRAGANFWIEKHRANVKIEAGQNRAGEGSSVKPTTVANLQAQLYF